MEVLKNIPVNLELEAVLKKLHMRNKGENVERSVQEVIDMARPVARPKAVYDVSYVENKNGDSLDIGGIRFTGRVLGKNLAKVARVFPYVVTCGRELEEIEIPSGEFIKTYYLDQIKEVILSLARTYLEDYLKRKYALGKMSRMGPGTGSIDDWPLTQQKELFSIFGNVEELIGVTLTDKCLMFPIKSTSGIYFPTEVTFVSCQLCPREKCIGRKADYSPEMAEEYRGKKQA